jgi:hypothetical protein
MRLIDSLLLSGSVAFLLISISQIFYGKFADSYWVLMLSILLLLLLRFVRNQRKQETMQSEDETRPVAKVYKAAAHKPTTTKKPKKKRK